MRKLRKFSKEYYLRQIMACWMVFCMLFMMPARVILAAPDPASGALPNGESVAAGSVGNFNRDTSNQLHIEDVANGTIINWNNFDIGSDALTEFHQLGGAGSAVLNRVHDGDVTGIMGQLTANGRVFVINPAGILFGSGCSVNVSQLVASSLNITDADFLNGSPYTFTGGAAAGDVINEGDDTISAERIMLIGKQVINRGALEAEDYVVMAAGETVLISDNSNVVVEVSMPTQTPGTYDYVVDHGGSEGEGDGTVDADHVILAAGDIWSAAIEDVETLRAEAKGNVVFKGKIYASSDGGSDAVAEVIIDAGGDVTVHEKIEVEADNDSGDPEDDAIATIKISAGGNVLVEEKLKADATTENGSGDALATIDIEAGGNVNIYTKKKVEAKAKAVDDSGDAVATIDIDAGGDIHIYKEVPDGELAETLKAKAEADGSGNALADIDITAAGNVTLDDKVEADAKAKNGAGSSTADILIEAGGNVIENKDIKAKAKSENGSGSATSNVAIDADGNVESNKKIEAKATTKDSDNATAGVDIEAGGNVNIYGEVEAEAKAEDGSGDATANVDIAADGDLTVESGEVEAEAETSDDSGDASAAVTVTATNVTVTDDGEIEAEAETENDSGDASATVTVEAANVTVTDDSEIKAEAETSEYSGDADASVDIAVDGDVLVENDSEITAFAQTYTYDSGDATASVDIAAGGDVTVIGHDDDSDGESFITAHAITNGPEYGDSSGDATANVDIVAGGDVTVSKNGKIVAVAVVRSGEGLFDAGDGAVALVTDELPIEGSPVIVIEKRDATAGVTIDAGGDVVVEYDSEVKAVAKVYNDETCQSDSLAVTGEEIVLTFPGDATASVDIKAGGDVTVEENSGVYAEAGIENYAEYYIPVLLLENGDFEVPALGDATATVDIAAGGDVTVENGGEVYAEAWIDNGITIVTVPFIDVIGIDLPYSEVPALGNAKAAVTIAAGGDVTVDGGEIGADAWIYNQANYEGPFLPFDSVDYPDLGDATASVDIDADGFLTVQDEGGIYADASIEYSLGEGGACSLGELALELEPELEYNSGDATASIDIDAYEGVIVDVGGEIVADAYIGPDRLEDESTLLNGGPPSYLDILGNASASVDIQTCGDVIVNDLIGAYAEIRDDTRRLRPRSLQEDPELEISGNTNADVIIKAYGDIIVNQFIPQEEVEVEPGFFGFLSGKIEAYAHGGFENSADVILLAVDNVIVNDGSSPFQILPNDGPFDGGNEVIARAEDGFINNAHVGIATRDGVDGGDVIVSGQVKAYANDGFISNAAVEISAARDLIVKGTSRKIFIDPFDQLNGVQQGGVIEAEAEGSYSNNANVKICAGRDVIVEGADIMHYYPEPEGPFIKSDFAQGGQILATTGNGDNGFNASEIEIYAGRDVIVEGVDVGFEPIDGIVFLNGGSKGGSIIANAGWNSGSDGDSTASVGVYAGRDVIVEAKTVTGKPEIDIQGDGDNGGLIMAKADGFTSTANVDICAADDVTIDGGVEARASGCEEESATINISAGDEINGTGYIVVDAGEDSIVLRSTSLSNIDISEMDFGETEPVLEEGPVDCPDCDLDFEWVDWDWCEDCEELFAPVATLAPWQTPEIAGCPVEMAAAAAELGITMGNIQVSIGNALALNPTIQACEACASLINAAAVLRDEDGSRMAAMLATFNALAPADAPFTPEMATTIATAFEGAAEGSQYATAMEYIDAFVQYVAVLDTELGSPVGDSVIFVMGKHGANITDSANPNIAAFVAVRLESL